VLAGADDYAAVLWDQNPYNPFINRSNMAEIDALTEYSIAASKSYLLVALG